MSDQQLLDAIDRVTGRLSSQPSAALIGKAGDAAAWIEQAIELLVLVGWIEASGADYALSRDLGHVIGLDLGGTKLRGAIGNAAGDILAEFDLPTANHAPDSALAQMADMARSLAAEAGIAIEAIEQIAVGVPGAVAPDGSVALSPNVSFQPGTSLAGTLHHMLGVPVSVDNDGNVSAFGEFVSGIGKERGAHSLAFLAIGTGVGMGLIVDGHLLHGSAGAAGEIAFLPFGADPFGSAANGPGGAFEAAVGSEAIRRSYAARNGGRDLGVREIFDQADQGDATAKAIVEQTIRSIAVGVASVIALLDPGIVVIGGGIGARPGLAAGVGRLTSALVPTACEVVASSLGDRAGVVGAVALARRLAKLNLLERHGAGNARGAAA